MEMDVMRSARKSRMERIKNEQIRDGVWVPEDGGSC